MKGASQEVLNQLTRNSGVVNQIDFRPSTLHDSRALACDETGKQEGGGGKGPGRRYAVANESGVRTGHIRQRIPDLCAPTAALDAMSFLLYAKESEGRPGAARAHGGVGGGSSISLAPEQRLAD